MFRGHGDGLAARGGDHPDAFFALVVLQDGSSDRVRHPLGVGAQLGIPDFANLEEIVDSDGARRRGLLSRGGERQSQKREDEREPRAGFHSEDS